jgi:hypothetical protein
VACPDSFILAPGRLTTEEEQPSVGQPTAVTDKTADAIVSPAPCNVGMEQSMPRRRYQRGRIISRGKKRKVWVGIFREDRVRLRRNDSSGKTVSGARKREACIEASGHRSTTALP